jgi:hypothetical protein
LDTIVKIFRKSDSFDGCNFDNNVDVVESPEE